MNGRRRPDAPSRGWSRILLLAVPWLLAAVTLAAWAIASPVGSSPDDNFHLPSIWCAQGENDSTCAAVDGQPDVRAVPDELVAAPCFAFDASKSAECQEAFDGHLGPEVPTGDGNWTGLYPPLFYDTMSVLIVGGAGDSVVLMRLFNSALLLGMLGALCLLLPRRLTRVAPLAFLVTSVPLALSVLPSTNPSSWTFVAAGTFWIALHGSFELAGRRKLLLLGVAVLAALLGAGSRADGGIFVVVGLAVVLVLRWRALIGPAGRRLSGLRRHVAELVAGFAAVAIAAWGYLVAGQSDAATSGLADPTVTVRGLELVWVNASNLPAVWFGAFGIGMNGLGWLDTPVPWTAGAASLGVVVAFVFTAWRRISRRQLAAAALLAVVIVAYPMYLLQQSASIVGSQFQPRYVFPALLVFVGVSLLSSRMRDFTRLQAWLLVIGLSVAQSLSLWAQIRRYVTGLDIRALNLDSGIEWWWSDSPLLTPMATWIAGSVAFSALCWWLFVQDRKL